MAKNVHIVPHIHWDREWYFTTEESRILLVNNMEEVLEMLETNENYPHYVLDGQTAVLEDYFDVKPENFERVKKLVEQGKLIIGPWYTQTDEMVVGGESIVRNLLYGMKDCAKLGPPMMIGYLPDSFGQSEKLPQILNGFDIDRCMFWRGTSERHGTDKHNFYWESESKGRVLTHLLPLGYAIGKYLPVEKEALAKRMSKYMPVLEKGAVNEEILVSNGHDQMPLQKDIFDVMDSLSELYPDKKFFLSRFEHIFDEMEKMDNLDTIKGELLDGKYMRVHRSIFSSRADLKAYNTRIENKITNILEPLASLAYGLGAEYHHGLMEAIWKELMKNHAHDSIGCCCSDKVHRAIENRFFLAEDKTDELIRFYKRKLADAISCEKALDKVVAFNLLPYDRTSVVETEVITKMKAFVLTDDTGRNVPFEILHAEEIDAGLIDRQIVHYGNYDPFMEYTIALYDTIPAMGYQTYFIIEAHETAKQQLSMGMENEFYQIAVAENGSLTILDKETNKTYTDVLLLEDGADDGDGYDYSPLEDDFILTSKDIVAQTDVETYGNKTVCTIAYTMCVPKDLEERKAKKASGSMDVELVITMKKGSPILEVVANIENRVCDHRVRVWIPNGVKTAFSVSDNQFGQIKRPVYDSAMDVWEKEGWDERPDSIYPMLSYVAFADQKGLAVLTNSVREFEIIGEEFDTLAITLFRSVGYLGKEEMYRRPGRPSGIKMPTPDSQMLGSLQFDFAIAKNTRDLATVAREYITPIVCYNKMPYNAMKLNPPTFVAPAAYSFLKVNQPNFVLSAFKKAECEDGYILRGYQVTEANTKVQVAVFGEQAVSALVNLNEKKVESLLKHQGINMEKNVVTSIYID
ncbi:mannosylglycerate hydrolase [Chakrabartyella piscis]|uniref:mannosylglycerate hydrolase n=1 Tax=Chakrabartyella piscis TaxID=2918914 RepID=UPI0029588FEF|nr:mannosylglycerate hydrolase [Chakrabartyella piscis]